MGRPRLIATASAMALAGVLVACGGATQKAGTAAAPTPGGPTPQQATQATSVKLPRDFKMSVYRNGDVLGGEDLQFSAVFAAGKPVILNFFAGLCPPCRAEMPDIQAVNGQYKDKVTIFGLDVGPFVGLGSRDDGKTLIRELGVTYPTGTTSDGQVVSAYQVLGMPTTVFITPEGKVFKKWTGLLTRAKLIELTEGLLKASGT